MVSRENAIIAGCVVAAVVLWLAAGTVDGLPSWVEWAVLFGVGIVLPGLLTRNA